MKKLLAISIFMALILSTASCIHSVESYLDSFESFVEEVEKTCSDGELTEKKSAEFEKEFQKYSSKLYDKYSEDMTRSDKIRFAKLCMRYYVALGKDMLDSTLSGIMDILTDENVQEIVGGIMKIIY